MLTLTMLRSTEASAWTNPNPDPNPNPNPNPIPNPTPKAYSSMRSTEASVRIAKSMKMVSMQRA